MIKASTMYIVEVKLKSRLMDAHRQVTATNRKTSSMKRHLWYVSLMAVRAIVASIEMVNRVIETAFH